LDEIALAAQSFDTVALVTLHQCLLGVPVLVAARIQIIYHLLMYANQVNGKMLYFPFDGFSQQLGQSGLQRAVLERDCLFLELSLHFEYFEFGRPPVYQAVKEGPISFVLP